MTVKEGVIVRYDGQTIKEFTKEQIDAIVAEATKNPHSNKVMLGRNNRVLSEISYDREAGKEYTYYELDNWDDLYSLVGEDFEQMFKLNEQFIGKQFSLGKQKKSSNENLTQM